MKKLITIGICAVAILLSTASFGQLLDEKNVVITMDLQPVLQLNLQGPDQFDFTFDEINEYYSGITKYGANILRVSASVSFDLWAVGLSQGQSGDFLWDNVLEYQGGGAAAINDIPITALELHQFPPNPSQDAGVGPCALTNTTNSDYSSAFAPFDPSVGDFAAGACDNNIYTAPNGTPYLAPTSTAAATSEKYIAGATGTGADCQIVGGSYLMQSNAALAGNTVSDAVGALTGYYFVMDYRILPALPAQFPCSDVAADTEGATINEAPANALAAAGESNFDADDATAIETAGNYAAPGVYQMYIKYILVEDQ